MVENTNTVVRNKGVYPCGSAILVTCSCLLVFSVPIVPIIYATCGWNTVFLHIYTLPRTTVLWKKQGKLNFFFTWTAWTFLLDSDDIARWPHDLLRFEGSSIPPRRWKMFSAGTEIFWRMPSWNVFEACFSLCDVEFRTGFHGHNVFRKPGSLHRPKRGKIVQHNVTWITGLK